MRPVSVVLALLLSFVSYWIPDDPMAGKGLAVLLPLLVPWLLA